MKVRLLICFVLFLIISCSYYETFDEREYGQETLILQEKETKGFSTNSLEWRFKLKGRPYVYVNALTTDWGPPFSTDVFEGSRFEYILSRDTAYLNSLATTATTHTFVYLDPKKYSEEDFQAYVKFMKENWQEIDSLYVGKDLRTFPRIIGLVYRNQINPEFQFKGKLKYLGTGDLRSYLLEIYTDGRIRLSDDSGFETYSGLSEQVEMPGKIIRFKKEGDYKIEDLKSLKNNSGKDFTYYFKILEE